MERLLVSDPAAVPRAAALLASGGVILYPTDTLYGLGADALSDEAVAKIYAIKGRDEKKPMHAIVADVAMAARYGEMNPLAQKLAEHFLPGPLTLILKKYEESNTGIARDIDTFGIRIPDNDFCSALAQAFDRPFTTTSANVSGAIPARTIDEIVMQFGAEASLIDLAIDAGVLPSRTPSTIVDASDGTAKILREGAISVSDIDSVVLA